MVRASPIQTSFAAGELSPRLAGRVDFAPLRNGLARCENFIVQPHGGIARRPGTRFVAEVANSDLPARLIPFVFDADHAYAVLVNAGRIRLFADDGAIHVPATGAAIANGTFAAGLAGWTVVVAGDGSASAPGGLILAAGSTGSARVWQAVGIPEAGPHVLRIRVAAGTVVARIGTTDGGAEIAGPRTLGPGDHTLGFALGGAATARVELATSGPDTWPAVVAAVAFLSDAALELTTPWVAAAPRDIGHAQSADTMVLTHPHLPPQRLARHGALSWSLGPYATRDGPWLAENADGGLRLTPAAIAGRGVAVIASGDVFNGGDVGRHLRLKHGDRWGWANIVAVSDARHAAVDVGDPFGGIVETPAWRLGAWGMPMGWPRCAAFHQQRLFFAGSLAQPQTIWGSRAGVFDSFAPTVPAEGNPAEHETTDECGLAFTPASDSVNAVLWLAPLRDLMIGTAGGEMRLAGVQDRALSPLNALIGFETAHGVANVRPARAGAKLLFVQRDGHRVRELGFDGGADGYRAPDATVLAEQVGRAGFVELAWQQHPDGLLWACDAAGGLAAMTYNHDQQVLGWHRHPTDGLVESLCVVPTRLADGGGEDRLWLVARRLVGGAWRRYVEYLDRAGVDQLQVDCGLSLASPTPVATVGGLAHLVGRIVDVVVDGAAHPRRSVGGDGTLSLAAPAYVVDVGLPYESVADTWPVEAGAQDGTAQGKIKRLHRVALRLLDSAGGEVGPVGGALVSLSAHEPGQRLGAAPARFTGDRHVELPPGIDRGGALRVRQAQPLPFTLLALMPRLSTSDGG